MNEEREKITDKINFLEKLKSNRSLKIVVIFIIGILVVSILFLDFEKTNSTNSEDYGLVYINELEDKLTETLSLVDGAGKVKVIINVDSGVKTVLATKKTVTEINGQKTIEETPIIVNGKTVVLYEEFPDITGVIIVAEGGDKISTISKLQQATVSLLKVDISQIEIMLMK